MLLIFDEAENINFLSSLYQFKRSINFLKSLFLTALNVKDLLDDFVEFDLEYCSKGNSAQIPFIYKIPTGLKLMFAFTSLDLEWIVDNFEEVYGIHLEPLNNEELKEVLNKIYFFYQNAYEFSLDKFYLEEIYKYIKQKNNHTRYFVKGSVEALDLIRFNPRKPLSEILI